VAPARREPHEQGLLARVRHRAGGYGRGLAAAGSLTRVIPDLRTR
jgi:hypothetical protein